MAAAAQRKAIEDEKEQFVCACAGFSCARFSCAGGGVEASFLITQVQAERLRELGYGEDVIRTMPPEEGQRL